MPVAGRIVTDGNVDNAQDACSDDERLRTGRSVRNDRVIREYLWKAAECWQVPVGISGCYGRGRKGGTGRLVKSLWSQLSAVTSMPRTEGGLLRFTYWKVPNG